MVGAVLTEEEGRSNCLFNNVLNTFYLWLVGVTHMVKDISDSKRKLSAATTWATLLAAGDLLYAPLQQPDVKSRPVTIPIGVRCSSVVRAFAHGAMDRGSILHGGPIELFLVPASAPRLV